MGERLKPCPFCGSEGILSEVHVNCKDSYYVDCGNLKGFCPVLPRTFPYYEKQDAITAWNNRAEKE